MKLRFIPVALLSVVALALTGCSAPSTTDESLSSVLDSGTLTIGTEGTYRPFSFHEGGSGALTGYDVAVARAVAAELGVDAVFEETQWDGIFAGLTAGRWDTIANQVSMTPERVEAYEFSTPYTYSPGVIVVLADNTSITSFASLDGLTTAQSLSSNWDTLATESGANVKHIEGWAQSVALVEQGRVDATINDKLTFLDYQKTNDADNLKIAAETKERSESAFAFAKDGTALADAVSGALATLSKDGTLAKLSDKYFGADVSQ
ncbi:transporter substrate-binding domain-containing protein [Cryobacterium sp. Y57]|uniref:transporter substrate-binding domain-containing protein n=1 Tax=Cryobacterium sp. Y57 TaxID=2048287 RepID=UPI000CE4A8CB|nr:transporter substrate-binding domain-containing protein [Cryobacterium sp. Y57]